ncbi:hypothetical protein [Nonomuraea sp. NBC_01738]|uniref:hypothetical protein n=1 Tax=Nonomuraea sp. NBC_01738 TaxID=2976003 RepID=UPI002E15C52A
MSVPPRDYSVLGVVLAGVVEALGAGEQAEKAARKAGERLGRAHRERGQDVAGALRERGYEPYARGDRLRMRNCPFHVLSLEEPVLVCSMNLALCQGLLEGLGEDPARAALEARPGECCVSLSKTNVD